MQKKHIKEIFGVQNGIRFRLILLILILLMLPFHSAFAKHVLPVFSGYWYKGVDGWSIDACTKFTATYIDRFPVSEQELARQLLQNVPERSDCEWQDVQINYKYSTAPLDFVGDNADWAEISQNPNSPTGVNWRRDCVNNDSGGSSVVYDYVSTSVFPSYICPLGSRESLDLTDQRVGCSTEPTACNADIVGRDLSSIPIQAAGHVGLVQQGFPGSVLEVLKDPQEGIFLNSLSDFKNQAGGSYWGEKFDLPLATIDIWTALDIFNTGMDQVGLPFKYTAGWDWHPGEPGTNAVYDQGSQEWVNILTTTEAKFRCDSFVYYAYLAGANLHIVPDFSLSVVPRTLFDSFLSFRDSSEDMGVQVAGVQNANPEVQNLEILLAGELSDLAALDKSSYTYVKNPYIPRLEKINTLWALAKKHQNNNTKFTYILDCLETLKPIQLAEEFINNYHSQVDVNNKVHLLFTLEGLINDNAADQQIIIKDHVKEVTSIQQFFKELLSTATERKILRVLVQLYPNIVPPDQAEADITAALNRPMAQSSDPLFTEGEEMTHQLWLAFSSEKQQAIKIPALLNKARSSGNKQLFASKLCSILKNISPDAISEKSRRSLSKYLLDNQAMLIDTPIFRTQKDIASCNWLSAYATLMVHGDKSQKDSFILNYIRHQSDDRLQAKLLNQLHGKQYSLMSKGDREYYKAKFQTHVKNPNISRADRDIYMRAAIDRHTAGRRAEKTVTPQVPP